MVSVWIRVRVRIINQASLPAKLLIVGLTRSMYLPIHPVRFLSLLIYYQCVNCLCTDFNASLLNCAL